MSKPSSGTLEINGEKAEAKGNLLRRQIGVISHNSFLYEKLTAVENLKFYGMMYDVSRLKDRIYDALEEVGLQYAINEPVRTFSRGMLQRLSIARAIIHDPAILFLDEPYTGLDQQAIGILNSVLRRLRNDRRTIFMITHNFAEGLEMSDRVLILYKGRVVYENVTAGLTAETFKEVYLQKVESA